MSTEEIHELCDQADAIDPLSYFDLCENSGDLSDDEFVEGLERIIQGDA